MRLTPQGQTLLDYAVRAFELLAEGESLVQADRGALVGTVAGGGPFRPDPGHAAALVR